MLKILRGDSQDCISEKLTRELVDAAVQTPEKKFFIIVPEQATLQTQMKVATAHPGKACMNIDVVSFNRLAHVVLDKIGMDTGEILDDIGKALVLRKVLSEIGDDLEVYGNKVHMAGFVEEIKSMITEFKQYRVDDAAIGQMQTEAAGKSALLTSKLKDIRLIYNKFNEAISGKYKTSEEVLEVFAGKMGQSGFLKGCDVYLDGFTGFTPIQRQIIVKMLGECENIVVSLVLPDSEKKADPKDFELFKLSNDTYNRLEGEAADARAEFKDIYYPGGVGENKRQAQAAYFPTSDDEIAWTAGEIKRLVQEQGLRYRDIAVIASDMEEYHRPMDRIFEEAGIEAFVDYKEPLSDNALIRYILPALIMSASGMSVKNVFAVLKNSLSGIPADRVARLENYCLEFNIKGPGRWEAEFTFNRLDYVTKKEFWDLDELNEARKDVCRILLPFYRATSSGSRDVKIYCKMLEKFLEVNGIEKKMQKMASEYSEAGALVLAKEYESICDDVNDLIQKIDRLMEGEKVTPREFAEIFTSGVGEIKVGVIPPSVDSVIAGDLTRTRLGRISHLFMLGMNEGKIPSKGKSSAILTQREREFLLEKDFEIAPTAFENLCTERFYAHMAFNKPAEKLYLSWVREQGDNGLEPSSILNDMDELAPDIAAQIDVKNAAQNPPLPRLWKNAALRQAAAQVNAFVNSGMPIDPGFMRAVADADGAALKSIFAGAFYTNVQTPLDSQVALDLYGGVLSGSVSRFESFFNCPYRHFLTYGIGIEKRREYKLEVTDLGTIYHSALEKYSKRLEDEGTTFRTVSDDDSHRFTKESVDAAVAEQGSDFLQSSAQNQKFMDRICQITQRTTDVLREHVKAGKFEPEKYEMSFEYQVNDDIKFRGKIDRIDIYDADDIFIKIIDYKSGSKAFSVEDIYAGLQLQLVAYVKSAVAKIKENHPDKNVLPGGIYYYRINDKYIKPGEEKNKFQMSGLTNCTPGVPKAIDGGIDENKDKYGSAIISNTKANGDEFDKLIEFVDLKIEEAGRRVREGDVAINPYDKGHQEGCMFCDFKEVCRFDDGVYGSVCRRDDEVSKKEKEAAVYGRN